jgi:hypothetical protein
MIEINDECMFLAVDGRVIATARLSPHAAADGHGAWIVSCLPNRLLTRDQTITATALTAAELLAVVDNTSQTPQSVARMTGVRSWIQQQCLILMMQNLHLNPFGSMCYSRMIEIEHSGPVPAFGIFGI